MEKTMNPTAALIIIGEEILNGRTKDKNIGYIAEYLTNLGINLREVRVIGDEEAAIVEAVNALRAECNYVFTCGGIGPTHDDITADSIAKAFGVPISENAQAIEMLLERYAPEDLNAGRRRMARIPHGAALIPNSISKAPGFILENVHVMAGVPNIMQVMMDALAPQLAKGQPLHVVTIDTRVGEGTYAEALREIAAQHPTVSIGSYPRFTAQGFATQIIIRGKNLQTCTAAADAVHAMLTNI